MINIVGSNIAGLIFDQLLRGQNKPSYFLPIGPLGSGWGGVNHQSNLLDLGQRFFELDFENSTDEPIENYETNKSQRNFVHLVRNLIESEGFVLQPIKVEAYFRGSIIKCPLETVDLTEVKKCLGYVSMIFAKLSFSI